MRIFYLCPDFNQPSGGVKRLYTHVKILRENGYDAYITHVNKGFKLDWFESQVPIIYLADSPQISPQDVLVFPESLAVAMENFKELNVKKVAIALNPHYIFRPPVVENWKVYGINWVVAGNKIIEELIKWSMDINNVYTITKSIDFDMFYFEPEIKQLQVAYMTRKDTLTPTIEKIIKLKNTSLNNMDFIKLENLKINDYAQILKESQIYITTSAYEGIHASVLEAMACGCLCIGFDGIGAKDYVIDSGDQQNFIRAESMNFIDLSKKFIKLIDMINSKDPVIETIRQNAISTAAKYSSELEKDTLLKFWRTFLKAESNSICTT